MARKPVKRGADPRRSTPRPKTTSIMSTRRAETRRVRPAVDTIVEPPKVKGTDAIRQAMAEHQAQLKRNIDAQFNESRKVGRRGARNYFLLIGGTGGPNRGFRDADDPTAPSVFGGISKKDWDGNAEFTRFTVNVNSDLVIMGSAPRIKWGTSDELLVTVVAFEGSAGFTLTWDVANEDYRGTVPTLAAYFDANEGKAVRITVEPL